MSRPPKLQPCTSALCLVLLMVAGGSVGCRVYEGRKITPSIGADSGVSEGPVPPAADAGDAGTAPTNPRDAAPHDPESCLWGECWWSKGGGDTCQTASAPTAEDRPSGDDDITRVADFYLGLTNLRLGSTNRDGEQTEDAWEDFGLDLDGVCTNSATCTGQDAVSCRAMGPEIPFDGQLCRDNTFARLQPVVAAVPELGERFGLSEESFNCELWRGGFNMILRISGYSGEPDDPQVRVDLYTSSGIQEELAWKCPDAQYRQRPRWLSSRKWGIDESWLTGPITEEGKLPDSKYADPNAYVRNGYLVAQMPEGAPQGFVGSGTSYRGFMFTTRRMMFIGHLYHVPFCIR